MRRIKDGRTVQLNCHPKQGDITSFTWCAESYEGCDSIIIHFNDGSDEILHSIPLEVVEAWIKVIEDGSRSEFFYRDNIKGKYFHPTESSTSDSSDGTTSRTSPSYVQEEIKTVSMIDFILKKIETLDEKELEGIKNHVNIRLAEIESAKPWNRRPIPDYLKNCVEPITENTWSDTWYDDVWYHAAKDGMMGPQIRRPGQIPLDATHIIEIHK